MLYCISGQCLCRKHVTIFAQSIKKRNARLYARFYAAKRVPCSDSGSIFKIYSQFSPNQSDPFTLVIFK